MAYKPDQLPAPQQTWGDWFYNQAEGAAKIVGDFVEKNFATISFVASSVFTAMYAPALFVTGAAIGAAMHHNYNPNLKVDAAQEKIITVYHATFAIVAAVATFVTMIADASLISSCIPLIFSLGAGSAGYRAYSAWIK